MHWNALHDPQIQPDAKTQVRRNVSGPLFLQGVLTHLSMKNSALTFHDPDAPEYTM
jgi:hypothetical protein